MLEYIYTVPVAQGLNRGTGPTPTRCWFFADRVPCSNVRRRSNSTLKAQIQNLLFYSLEVEWVQIA